VDMLGPMPGFDANTPEDASYYSQVEAAVWGNLFSSPPSAHFSAAAGGATPCLTRMCASGPPPACLWNSGTSSCGSTLRYTGWNSMSWDGGGYYVASVTEPGTGRVWSYAITTYLHPGGAGEACKGVNGFTDSRCQGASEEVSMTSFGLP
jgi:hypothetical protein